MIPVHCRGTRLLTAWIKPFSGAIFFRRKHVISRLNDGPFQPYLDSFATALDEQRYGRNTIKRAICAADHFGRWLLDQNLAWTDAHGTTVSRYYNLLGRCEAGDWPHRLNGLHIALWLGHESIETTHCYVEADLATKQRALDKITPIQGKLARFQPDNMLLAFRAAL
jgi:hypothetical protein